MENYIHKGYYAKRHILCEYELKKVGVDLFPQLEIDDPNERCPYTDASDFLMGSCQLFAIELNEKYGYPIYEINLNGQLIHCFCKVQENDTTYYIDVRGITTDFTEFMSEVNVLASANFKIKEYADESLDEWDEVGLRFARLLIERNPEYYEI